MTIRIALSNPFIFSKLNTPYITYKILHNWLTTNQFHITYWTLHNCLPTNMSHITYMTFGNFHVNYSRRPSLLCHIIFLFIHIFSNIHYSCLRITLWTTSHIILCHILLTNSIITAHLRHILFLMCVKSSSHVTSLIDIPFPWIIH